MAERTTVIFDLGGVLIDWNPRYLYRKIFHGDEAKVEYFLTHICSFEWNERHDAGVSIANDVKILQSQHPEYTDAITAYYSRFDETMSGAIEANVNLLRQLKDRHVPIYALTNWSSETFPVARKRFAFLRWFNGIVVSGEEKVKKPDPRIFQILLKRYNIDPKVAVYIDDVAKNALAAADLGLYGYHYRMPQGLLELLQTFKLV